MSAPSDKPPIAQALRHRAVDWRVRVSSDEAQEADWLAFEAWLAEDPDHGRAYAAVEQVWMDLDDAPPQSATNVVPLKARPPNRRAIWMGAAAASLVGAAVIGTTVFQAQAPTESYDTAFGQQRIIALSDGSRITLNGGSHIEAVMGRRERRVVMADAEAAFDVAHDPGRPFIIQAGDREIRVVGTEFNVLHHAGDTKITVRRGVVEVRPTGQSGAKPIARLTKGQSLAHQEGKPGDAVAAADPEAAFAWTTGRLVFQGERLEAVALTLNRYVPTPITVAPDARALPVTAVLTLGGEDEMLKTLAAFLPVQADRQAASVRLSLRRQTR